MQEMQSLKGSGINFMKKFISTLMLSVLILLTGCGSENSKPEPAPKENQTKQVEEKPVELVKEKTPEQIVAEEFASLPSKISSLPSIGATREEFENYHVQSGTYGKNRIAYDNDTLLVDFFDANGNESTAMNSRAYMVSFQSLPERRIYSINIDDYVPFDTDNFVQTRSYKDSMMDLREWEGYSETMSKIFPFWKGKFGIGITYDTPTGNFIGATIAAL